MTAGLPLPLMQRRPTPGALYVLGVAAFAVLLLVLVGAGAVDPVAVVLAGVPLGPLGVVAAAFAMPVFTGTVTLPVAAIVLAAVLAIAAVNVMAVAFVASVASGRPLLRRSR